MSAQLFTRLSYSANPYLPGKEHVPDGEPHIFGDRLYIYGSHDLKGTERYCAGSYVGWSAPLADLSDWRYEGEIYAKGEDPLDPDGNADYYAPDVVCGSDGRYYLYYSINESNVISVAAADHPAGPFHFYGHVKDHTGHVLGSAPGDAYQFDPALLNDDGRIYLYSGQGLPVSEVAGRIVRGAMVCELEADMLTIKGEQKTITSTATNCFTANPFFEASSIRKIDGLYYFIYSALPNTHNLCYAVSRLPDRDFIYGGVLVSNADIIEGKTDRQQPMNYWGNNHGSILELNGEYYIFYHRNTARCAFARQGCVEHLEKRPDGGFVQAELTSLGLSPIPFPAGRKVAAYTACLLSRKNMPAFEPFVFFVYTDEDPYIDEEEETDIPFIRNLRGGAMAGFRYFDAAPESSSVKITARGKGQLEIVQNGRAVGSVTVDSGDIWKEYTAAAAFVAGKSEIRLVAKEGSRVDLLWICICS